MRILNDRIVTQVKSEFQKLKGDVKINFFTQELECEFCRETGSLLRELVEISDRLKFNEYNFQIDRDAVQKYRIDKIPATVIEGDKDYGIRFYGIPSGYEFSSLLGAIIDVSSRSSGLSQEIVEQLRRVNKPVHIQVFVTPTCPYCPSAVRTAHKFAMENENIIADMIEVSEFPHLAVKYGVRGVPKTVINEKTEIVGAVPEEVFLENVLSAVMTDQQ